MEISKLTVSSTPHIRENNSIDDIMLDVILALMPAAFAGVIFFGARALAVIVISVLSCVAFEGLFQIIAHKKVTIKDMSAVVTGMLLAFSLPPTIPYYMVVIGALVAIVITKQLYGGLGQNFMNPALVGRAFLLASFPVAMTKFSAEKIGITENMADIVTTATPLSNEYSGQLPSVLESLFGRFADGTPVGGCIGETCAVAILIGLVYLLIRRVISLRIPLSFIGIVGVLSAISGINPIAAVCSGGLMLGAVFMATDYVTSPTTAKGQIIFGLGCGAMTFIIRNWGGYPEGITYAILLMNVLTPLIDKWTVPKAFGAVKNEK